MGFREPDLREARSAISQMLREINSPYNDGFTSYHCKYELFLLKSWLDEQYSNLPQFDDEPKWQEEWEQERTIRILKS